MRYIIECIVTAQVRETWEVEADSEEAARTAFDDYDAEWIEDYTVEYSERDREIESVRLAGTEQAGSDPA